MVKVLNALRKKKKKFFVHNNIMMLTQLNTIYKVSHQLHNMYIHFYTNNNYNLLSLLIFTLGFSFFF